jgi:hypothetical protein
MREQLLTIRPEVLTKNELENELEQFQNQTLRPILKFQNDLLLRVMQHYITKRKGAFHDLTKTNRAPYLEHAVRQDLRFKSLLLGIVIGHFTATEFAIYVENEAELSRRCTDLLVQRFVTQVDLLLC